MVLFTIDVGRWCYGGGSVIELWDEPNLLSLVYLPNPRFGGTTALYGTARLSVGTHRMSGGTGSHLCTDQDGVLVSLQILDYFHVVDAKPSAPPATGGHQVPPPPQQAVMPALPRVNAPPALAGLPPAATSLKLRSAAAMQEPPRPQPPIGPMSVVAVLAAAVVLGGLMFRRRVVRTRRL